MNENKLLKRSPAPKRARELLEKQFAREFVSNGLNGTKAYKAIKAVKNDKVASVQASRLLSKDNVKKSIVDLLPDDSVETGIIKQAMQADRPTEISWKDLRGYVETSLKLKGHLSSDGNRQQVNIGIRVG